MKNKVFIFCLFVLLASTAKAQPGANDPTFNTYDDGSFGDGTGFNGEVMTTTLQSDGKVIAGGEFTSYNGTAINRIARLNVDGRLDTVFNPFAGFNNSVYSIAVQSDGKVIVGGNFTSFNFTTINRIARLNEDGSHDIGFNPGTGFNNNVRVAALQSDGKIIVVGGFTTFNGTAMNRIARLNVDGSLDTSFNIGTGFNNEVWAALIQSDGKIIIGGDFTSFNGTAINRIARLNSDGSLDTGFNPGTAFNLTVQSISIQSDGKIIVGGCFTTFNQISRTGIARLNTDGSLDLGFNSGTGFNNMVYTTAIQPNGKILVGGNFTTFNGNANNNIARLSSDGGLDTSFNANAGMNGSVRSISLQSDGKIIVGGTFWYFSSIAVNCNVRLNADGSLDLGYNPSTGFNRSVNSIKLQSDGKIIVGGFFNFYNGIAQNRIVRLNIDGSKDNSFNVGSGFDYWVHSIEIQNDGKIIVGGNFNYFNGTARNGIARLNADGTLDMSFNPGTGFNLSVQAILLQPDGKIIVGGYFTSFNGTAINRIARLNVDGSLDTSFNPGSGFNGSVRSLAIQPDAKIIVGGSFSFFNGTSRKDIARLNTDGSLDMGFNPGTGSNYYVHSISLQSDGKIIVGGGFTFFNGISRNRIARLNADGSLDTSFNPGSGSNSYVNATAIQSNGKIIVGGDFSSFNGSIINGIARLNSDGSLDMSFISGYGFDNRVSNIAIQSDGKIVVGGDFWFYNGIGRNRIARLLSDNVGIETSQKQSIKLFPNPNDGQFIIELYEESNITVINSLGATVHRASYAAGSHSLDLSYLPSGVYLIKSESKDNVNVLRVVMHQH